MITPFKPLNARLISPLGRNILLINLITLMIPVFGFLYLTNYRHELERSEVQNVKQETKIFADALAIGAVRQFTNGHEFLELNSALQIIRRLSTPNESRAILFLNDGTVISDSRQLHNDILQQPLNDVNSGFMQLMDNIEDKIHSILNYLEGNKPLPNYVEPAEMNIYAFPNAIKALSGESIAQVWTNKQNSLITSAAAPVQPLHKIFGALLLIRSSNMVEKTIRELRWNILQAFFVSFAFTVTMSLVLARNIAHPLFILATAAQKFGQPQHKLSDLHIPILRTKEDEIGILSRALSSMTENLKERISTIEGFAADVAHEIRNPISGISSALETYQVIKAEDKRENLMHMMQTELRRIDIMIDDILEASRLDAALMAETRETIDMVQWLAHFTATFHDVNTDQELSVQFPSQRVWVSIKVSRLNQVLQNIIGNARDFQPQGIPIEIRFNTTPTHAVLEVIDSGIGIPEQSLERIFNRFYSDRPDAQKGIHTGLGLSIVKQIIEGYNGTIIAGNRRELKTGAIFTISLPLQAGQYH